MVSLTPADRNAEATDEAMQEGLVAGSLVIAPCLGALFIAMKKSPTFVARTNWQSRTAIVIMPALFAFAWSAERHLDHKMHKMAEEGQHNRETVKWAEQHHRASLKKQQMGQEVQVIDLYRKSIEESGVNIIPGDTLALHHRMANYVSANPIKALAGLAVPSVALIFYGKSGKQHLKFSMQLLHTRIFGQFATISLMLTIMGFKDYMDQNGNFITEVEADRRVKEMQDIRQALMDRLDYEEETRDLQDREIALAHEQVMEEKRERKAANRKSIAI